MCPASSEIEAPAFIVTQIIAGVLGAVLAVVTYPVLSPRARVEEPAHLTG
jgi:hypothetical protein